MHTNILIAGKAEEIIADEGKVLTQAFPTHYPDFYTNIILVGPSMQEQLANIKEIDGDQVDQMKRESEQFTPPSKEFIEQSEAAGATYNYRTSYFELNDLVDITEDQMRDILLNGRFSIASGEGVELFSLRTNIFHPNISTYAQASLIGVLTNCSNLEVANVGSGIFNVKECASILSNNRKLKKIIGRIRFTKDTIIGDKCFIGLPELESVQISTAVSLNLYEAPNLNFDSLEYLVRNSINTDPITIIIHPNAYNRITNELLEVASGKQITFKTKV